MSWSFCNSKFKRPKSSCQPCTTFDVAPRLIKESKEVMDDAIPWTLESDPLITSPTTKLSSDETVSVVIFESQLWTVPAAESDVIDSPSIKFLVVNKDSNIGKCLDARIFPEELTESKVPGKLPLLNNPAIL